MFPSRSIRLAVLLRHIDRADREQIDRIVDHAMARYQALYPEYDMVYLALPRENTPRRRVEVAKLMQMLKKYPLD